MRCTAVPESPSRAPPRGPRAPTWARRPTASRPTGFPAGPSERVLRTSSPVNSFGRPHRESIRGICTSFSLTRSDCCRRAAGREPLKKKSPPPALGRGGGLGPEEKKKEGGGG